MNVRSLFVAAALALPLYGGTARAELPPISAEEFQLWKDYKDALSDERVQKMPEKQRMPAIARNFKVSEKKLKEAVDKGEQYGESVGKEAEAAVKASFADTELAPRIKEIKVDTSASHIIAYVHWAAEKTEKIDQEAALVAARAHKAAPIASTISLWASDPKDDSRKLFEALIGGEAAARIKESSIVDFASTRYIKLFEKVKRAE